MMSALSDLPNVGKVLEDNLRKINIETPEQLRQIGAEEAFFRIRMAVDPGACLHCSMAFKVLLKVYRTNFYLTKQKSVCVYFIKRYERMARR